MLKLQPSAVNTYSATTVNIVLIRHRAQQLLSGFAIKTWEQSLPWWSLHQHLEQVPIDVAALSRPWPVHRTILNYAHWSVPHILINCAMLNGKVKAVMNGIARVCYDMSHTCLKHFFNGGRCHLCWEDNMATSSVLQCKFLSIIHHRIWNTVRTVSCEMYRKKHNL